MNRSERGDSMGLFNFGAFVLHSGEESNYKIDCDYLSGSDIEALAQMIASTIWFGDVVGIPMGGDRLAAALKKYARGGQRPMLLVDDVYTTGRSMEVKRSELLARNPSLSIVGVVIFARRLPPEWIHALFRYGL
jgi:orotate phosphoribosyltransferase